MWLLAFLSCSCGEGEVGAEPYSSLPGRLMFELNPPSLILRPAEDFFSRLRPELNKVLSSSNGLVRGLPLAGLKRRGEEEQECALLGSGRVALTGEYGGGFPWGSTHVLCDTTVFGESELRDEARVKDRKLASGGKGK